MEEDIFHLKQYLDDIKKTNVQCVLVGNKVGITLGFSVGIIDGNLLGPDG